MVDKNNTITSRQLMTLVLSAQIGFGIITLPGQITKKAGHNGWICMLLAGLFSLLCSWLIILLMQRYGDKSIYEINRLLFGNIFGGLFNVIILLYLVITASLAMRLFSSFVGLTILPNTPPIILTFFLLIPTAYVSWYGLKPLVRLNNTLYPILIATLLFLLFIYKQLTFSFLLPIAESGLIPILQGTQSAFFGFIGLELVIVFYTNVTDKPRVKKFYILGNVISTLFFSFIVITTTAFFGENFLKTLVLPVYTLAGAINAPVFERVDIYFAVFWFIATGNSMRSYLFAGYYSINRVFGLGKRKVYLAVYIAGVVLLSRIPKDLNDMFRYSDIINFIALGLIGFLFICLLLSILFKKGGKKK